MADGWDEHRKEMDRFVKVNNLLTTVVIVAITTTLAAYALVVGRIVWALHTGR